MLDLQIASGTVDHNILCDKLQVLGVLSTEWFIHYLFVGTDNKFMSTNLHLNLIR
jgi:hypothetical protein